MFRKTSLEPLFSHLSRAAVKKKKTVVLLLAAKLNQADKDILKPGLLLRRQNSPDASMLFCCWQAI